MLGCLLLYVGITQDWSKSVVLLWSAMPFRCPTTYLTDHVKTLKKVSLDVHKWHQQVQEKLGSIIHSRVFFWRGGVGKTMREGFHSDALSAPNFVLPKDKEGMRQALDNLGPYNLGVIFSGKSAMGAAEFLADCKFQYSIHQDLRQMFQECDTTHFCREGTTGRFHHWIGLMSH
jgi:hypothetical protein